jgi:hypothetical protein
MKKRTEAELKKELRKIERRRDYPGDFPNLDRAALARLVLKLMEERNAYQVEKYNDVNVSFLE